MAADQLSVTFAALADPTRRAILARLSSGEASVGELAAPFDISLPAITKHLKVLQRAGLHQPGTRGAVAALPPRGQAMREAVMWMESYREHWERRLDRLDDYLRESNGREPTPVPRGAAARRNTHDPPGIPHALQRPFHQARLVRHRASLRLRPLAGVPRLGGSGGQGALVQRPPDKWSEEVREMDVRVGGRDRLIGKFVDGSESRFEARTSTSCRRSAWSTPTTCTGRARRSRCRWPAIEFVLAGKGTKLVLTEQHAFLDGYEDGGSRERGTRRCSDNLAHRWRRRSSASRRPSYLARSLGG
jgi:hypothetical protein